MKSSCALRPLMIANWSWLMVVLLASLIGRAGAQDQERAGVPWTGEAGITESVDTIMARDHLYPPPVTPQTTGKPQRISPDRNPLPQDPKSPPLAAWPRLPEGVPAVGGAYGQRAPQALGISFVGVALSEAGFIPPDTIGDVSATQIIACSNGRIKVFNKSGTLGGLNVTMNTFFSSVRNGSGVSDPVVRYDRLTDRWFVIGINVSTPNRIVLAVSSPGAITGQSNFTFFQFQQDLVGTTPNADTGTFADYCTLGVDVNALYIGCRMFNPSFYNTSVWVVRKSSMTGGGPIVVTPFRSLISGGAGIDGPRGVHNDDPAATQGYFIGADVNTLGRLVLRRISNPGATPTISSSINLTVPSTSIPENVPAQGSTVALEAVDDRIFAAHIRKNKITNTTTLWAAHAIEVNSSGVASSSGNRDAMRWYEIQNFNATPSLRQSGTLFDSAASSPRYYWMGSVNMSGQGHAAVGASYAATDEFAGAATAGRLRGDTLGTLRTPSDIIAGAAAYNQSASGRNRWGDYSHTVVDPADDMTMWTFQEYCSGNNAWSVRVTQLLAPPPATPISCSPASVARGSSGVNVTLTGALVSGSGFFDPGAGFPNHIAASISGTGVTVNSVTFVSETQVTLNVSVTAGATLSARTVTVTNPDGQALASATGILTVTSGACTSPTITANPGSLSRCIGASASFTAAASGTSPVFQWRKGLVNIGGATSPTLTITSVASGDAGSYDCVVTNTCGSATTTAATLAVEDCCPADFNQDGGIDGSDVDAFFNAWTTGNLSADVNHDGGVDGSDVEAFFTAWENGGC